MKLNEVTREIVLVSGRLCSGKGHYCANRFPGYHIIPVSSAVRAITQAETRSALTDTKDLDKQIVRLLTKEIDKHNKVVVEGIRQPSILIALKKKYGPQITDIIWLDVPEDIRRERFMRRLRAGEDLSFSDANVRDEALGINDIERNFKYAGRVDQN